MSDLVERLSSTATGLDYLAVLIEAGSHVEPSAVAQCAENVREAIARITELETALAEMTEDRDLWKQSEAVASEQFDKAEERVIAEVAAWLRKGAGYKDGHIGPGTIAHYEKLATALASGEWKK